MISVVRQLNRHRVKIIRTRRQLERIYSATQEQFDLAGLKRPKIKLHLSGLPVAGTDVILRKENGKIVGLVNGEVPSDYLYQSLNKLSAYIHWFTQTPDSMREIIVDASDGNTPSTARYKFSTNSVQFTPLPDAHFFRAHGYRETDQFAANNKVSWEDRKDEIIWRGALNNDGHFSLDPEMADNPGVMQRLRMAVKCQKLDVDFRFVARADSPSNRLLQETGLVGSFIQTHDWGGMKYAIDIDGYTNAWCNFMQRLKLGCCVLKVESQFGYYQWYYHKLIPWEHFVPIRADLSDLTEKVDWVKSNQTKAREIAQNGQAFANALTFESECQVAANNIETREQSA